MKFIIVRRPITENVMGYMYGLHSDDGNEVVAASAQLLLYNDCLAQVEYLNSQFKAPLPVEFCETLDEIPEVTHGTHGTGV